MIQQQEALAFLSQHKSDIEKQFFVTKLGIFGSVARNEACEHSDIDVLVEFAEDTPNLWDVKEDLRLYIASRLNVRVDVCREKYIKPLYRTMILREALYV
jgi:predicted nucleotidyltransferase